jgi:hypothetical protein
MRKRNNTTFDIYLQKLHIYGKKINQSLNLGED